MFNTNWSNICQYMLSLIGVQVGVGNVDVL